MKRVLILSFCFLIIGIFAGSASAQNKEPKTVRDFFMLLPGEYFSIDCCGVTEDAGADEKKFRAAKEKYLKQYLDVEDTANGYMKAGGDGAQDAFEMAIFKRADGTYLVGLYTIGEGDVEDVPHTVFLDYKNGKWSDVSKNVITGYDPRKLIYELPRNGTTVKVFAKDELASDFNKGRKLFDLLWQDGRFLVKN